MAERFTNTVNIMKRFRVDIEKKCVDLQNEISDLELSARKNERAITDLRNRELGIEREHFLLRRNQIEVNEQVQDPNLHQCLVIYRYEVPQMCFMRVERS